MFKIYGQFEPFDHPLSHEFVADAKQDGPTALIVGIADKHEKLLEVHYLGMLDADSELWLKHPFGRASKPPSPSTNVRPESPSACSTYCSTDCDGTEFLQPLQPDNQ